MSISNGSVVIGNDINSLNNIYNDINRTENHCSNIITNNN